MFQKITRWPPYVRASPGAGAVVHHLGGHHYRARLAALLRRLPGVEVIDRADRAEDPAGPGSSAPLSVVATAEPADPPVSPAQRPALSARQREVLVAYGAGNDLLPVVARLVGMAPETVKTHLRRIRRKYEDVGRPAPTRRDLYVRAVEDGLLIPPR